MRTIQLLILFILPMVVGFGQAGNALAEAERLMEEDQYLASNLMLQQFIDNNQDRKYDVARAWFLRSYNLLQLGDLRGAWQANEKSLQQRIDLRSGNTAENYMRRGLVLREQGDYLRALAALSRAREMPIEEAQLYALIAAYTGSVYMALGDYDRAYVEYGTARETMLIELGDGHPDLATLHYDIGLLQMRMKENEAAWESLMAARKIAIGLPGRADLLGQILNAMGRVSIYTAPASELDYYQQALIVYSNANRIYAVDEARTRLNLANFYYGTDEPKKAMSQLDSAVHLLTPGLAFGQKPDANSISINPLLLSEILRLQCRLYIEADNLGDVKKSFPTGMAAVEVLRKHMTTLSNETSRIRARELVGDVFGTTIDAAMVMADLTSGSDYEEEIILLAELSKGLSLRALQAEQSMPIELQNARAVLHVAQTAYALRPDDKALEGELATALAGWDQAIENTSWEGPKAVAYNQEFPSIDQLRQRLAADEVLLSYFVGEQFYYIAALSKDDLQVDRYNLNRYGLKEKNNTGIKFLDKLEKEQATGFGGVYSRIDEANKNVQLDRSVDNFLRAVRKVDIEGFAYEGGMLYGNLIAPVQGILRGKKRLLISPHRYLHALPFAALLPQYVQKEGKQKLKWHKLKYLTQQYTIRYAYASLAEAPTVYSENQDFVGLAPVFKDNNHLLAETRTTLFYNQPKNRNMLVEDDQAGLRFAELPFSEGEINGIGTLFETKGSNATILLNDDANIAAFRATLGQSRYLHLATHGFANFDRPSLSGIVFSQPESTDPTWEAGILYNGQIYDLPLNGQTVVLSACDSGLGEDAVGEGPFSPARAFLAAGASTVIPSLWKIYDERTASFMTSFYGHILEGKTEAAAIQAVQNSMIKNKSQAFPRFWAGFIVVN